MNIREAQAALNALGLGPVEVDGAWGRESSKALRKFQERNPPLLVDGALGPKSIAALLKALRTTTATPKSQIPAGTSELPWMAELYRRVGLHESRNKTELQKFLRSDGRTLGDPTKLPWCGDLVETVIGLTLPTELLPVNPYLARNWMKFGRSVEPIYGAVAVFWRGSRNGTSGHVGFIVGETKNGRKWVVAGGNQQNAITDNAEIDKSRLLGTRWPSSFPIVKGRLLVRSGVHSVNEA